jgi:hypothetical protein
MNAQGSIVNPAGFGGGRSKPRTETGGVHEVSVLGIAFDEEDWPAATRTVSWVSPNVVRAC